MSSQPPDAPKGGERPPDEAERPVTKWPRWRRSMLLGAIVLLAVSIADAAVDQLPRPLFYAAFFTGYVLLAYGFFLALAARNQGGRKR